ncbi:MAG: hypothetical protein IKU18_01400 [Bacteroidales bacterium]|nr:hypothetical protein [Bacteroidales bacterium]
MYYADSDLLSILLAIITMAAGIYSSTRKTKRREDVSVPNPFEEDDFLQMSTSVMDDASEEQFVEEQIVEEQSAEEQIVEEQVAEVQFAGEHVAEEQFAEEQVGQGPETVVEPVSEPEETVCEEEKQKDFKSRFKSSPKDAVLFAEILKPKYKEF